MCLLRLGPSISRLLCPPIPAPRAPAAALFSQRLAGRGRRWGRDPPSWVSLGTGRRAGGKLPRLASWVIDTVVIVPDSTK